MPAEPTKPFVCPLFTSKNSGRQFTAARTVMYGCSGQHPSVGVQLAEPFPSIHQERGADPSCLHRLGCKSWVTQVWFLAGIYYHLPELQRSKPRVRGASVCIHLKLQPSYSFRGEQERIMCDGTDNRGFDWRWFDYTTAHLVGSSVQGKVQVWCHPTLK